MQPYLSLRDFNPAKDGTTDDQVAFQAMFDEGVRRNIQDFHVPAGDYGIGSNIILPASGGSEYKTVRIFGYGAILQTLTNNLTIFDRSVADTVSTSSTAMVPTIEGFCFRGQAANTATAGIGLRWDVAHGAVFKNLDFQNLATGFQGIWCMESSLEHCNAQGTLLPYEVTNGDGSTPGAHRIPGVPPGTNEGTNTNSNSNLFTIKHSHAQLSHATAIGIKVLAAGNVHIYNTTVEGSLGDVAVIIDNASESGGVARRNTLIEKLWVEFDTSLNTVFKLNLRDSIVRVNTIVPSRTPNPSLVFIDDDTSDDSLIIVQECDFYNWNGVGPGNPWFDNVVNAAGDKNAYVFNDNVMHPSTPDITAAALWANGTPANIKGRTWVRGTRFETF
jgi:hypothetical protein